MNYYHREKEKTLQRPLTAIKNAMIPDNTPSYSSGSLKEYPIKSLANNIVARAARKNVYTRITVIPAPETSHFQLYCLLPPAARPPIFFLIFPVQPNCSLPALFFSLIPSFSNFLPLPLLPLPPSSREYTE